MLFHSLVTIALATGLALAIRDLHKRRWSKTKFSTLMIFKPSFLRAIIILSILGLFCLLSSRLSLTKISSAQRLQKLSVSPRIVKIPKKYRQAYQDDGFVVLPHAVDRMPVEELTELLLDQESLKQDEPNIFRSTLSSVSKTTLLNSAYFQPIADILFKSTIAQVLRDLLQVHHVHHFFDALYIKSPSEASGRWHRDYPVSRNVEDSNDMVSIWMPLVDLKGGLDGGSMVMAKGSHKWSLETGCTGLDHIGGEIVHQDWEGYDECMQRLDQAAVVLPAMAPGDIVVFHPDLFHKTASSMDLESPRLALSLVAITENAHFRVDQSDYECNVKPRVAFAMEEGNATMTTSFPLMAMDHLFPELIPQNAESAPKTIQMYNENKSVRRQSLTYVLGQVLLGCGIDRWLERIPHTYAPTI